MRKMIIGYTHYDLENKRMKLIGELNKCDEGTSEYNSVKGKFNRICLLQSALENWSKEHQGCWFCWDDMRVVEEDREGFKNYPGYSEEEVENDPDLENYYSGVPAIMRQPARIRATVEYHAATPNEDYDDSWSLRRHDLVSSSDGSVIISDIKRCPYCGRRLLADWGKPHRNDLTFWGLNDELHDYLWDEVNEEPWGDDEYDY